MPRKKGQRVCPNCHRVIGVGCECEKKVTTSIPDSKPEVTSETTSTSDAELPSIPENISFDTKELGGQQHFPPIGDIVQPNTESTEQPVSDVPDRIRKDTVKKSVTTYPATSDTIKGWLKLADIILSQLTEVPQRTEMEYDVCASTISHCVEIEIIEKMKIQADGRMLLVLTLAAFYGKPILSIPQLKNIFGKIIENISKKFEKKEESKVETEKEIKNV